MKKSKEIALILLLTVITSLLAANLKAQERKWKPIESGIYFSTVDENIWVFKIERPFKAKILYDKGRFDYLPNWLTKYSATAGINLGMFHDGENPSGYTKIDGKVIQPIVTGYNAFMVWDADTFAIMDRWEHNEKEIMKYPNVSQNIRMIRVKEKRNRWAIDGRKWSASTLGTDKVGNVYLFHTRVPYTMHEYIDVILKSDIPIEMMVYLEGGPESCIAVMGNFSQPMKRYSRMGSYETGFWENDDNNTYWRLPFVLAFYN